MDTRTLGTPGPRVSVIGLGCMGMSGMYGPADRAEALATIAAALDAGVNLLDTGDFHGMGHNELLIHEALARGDMLRGARRDRVVLSVKFGAMREPAGAWVGYDARPAAVKNFLPPRRRRRRALPRAANGRARQRKERRVDRTFFLNGRSHWPRITRARWCCSSLKASRR